MKKTKTLINIIIVGGVILTSCHDDLPESMEPETPSPQKSIEVIEVEASRQQTVIGSKLPDAYSLANMQNAYMVMGQKGIATKTLNIQTNKLYVRFLPNTLEEYELLADSLNLELFDFPLDYELISLGSHYSDPGLPVENPYTWLYTTVPANFNFPAVTYQVLENLFFPDEYVEIAGQINSLSMDQFLTDLEAESMLQANLITQEQYTLAKDPSKGRKKPEGFIKVRETNTASDIGVNGIRVRVFSGVRFDHSYTNSSGYYKMDKKFAWDVWYCVKCENATGAKIYENLSIFDEAKYSMGRHSNTGWSFTAQTNSCSWKWFTINNAITSYRGYCDTYGVSKPPADLRIWVDETSGNGLGSASMLRRTYGIFGFSTNSDVANFLSI